MIVLFTDFGLEGPYTGQVQAVLHQQAPGIPVVSLFSDLTPFDIQGAAYLLPAYTQGFPPGTVFLCVVDPGVGGTRPGVVVNADGRWYAGPDEGLFTLVARRAKTLEWWKLQEPQGISGSFHGRDVFAPVVARLARDGKVAGEPLSAEQHIQPDWPDDLYRVVYIDRFGNALTGVRASGVNPDAMLEINRRALRSARTFSDVSEGAAFWYENSSGLVEIAVNQGRAEQGLGLSVGTPFNMQMG
ncbi:MAG: SAM-dependent chlorinase/fluorinase [Pseudomonadota bacterium]|nr:SAM-dependent chlorinase/fluorinase [Pseudomonadota bacterium]